MCQQFLPDNETLAHYDRRDVNANETAGNAGANQRQ